jgi:hypothetical protein
MYITNKTVNTTRFWYIFTLHVSTDKGHIEAEEHYVNTHKGFNIVQTVHGVKHTKNVHKVCTQLVL